MKSLAPEKITIVIAEDHKLMRNGYVKLLQEKEHLQVTGEADNGIHLLEILETTTPDILLLDLEMPLMSGGEALIEVKRMYPAIKIIIVSSYYNENFISEYFLKGINGYLSKNCDAEQLIEAIESVVKEGYYFNTQLSKLLLSGMIRNKHYQKTLEEARLTETELKILKMLCEEKTSKEIAEQLNLTPYVVDHQRRNIQSKTQQSSLLGIYKFALRNGIAYLD